MKDCTPLNILVIGAGMYVCGRGTDGYGTILPALYQAKCDGLMGSLRIAATSAGSLTILKDKMRGLNELLGFDQQAELYPKTGKDSQAYRQAMQKGGKPDCAIVSVPDHLHYEITADLLKQGIHCLVVKPLAPTVAEVRELIRLAELKGIYGAVEFHKRYDRSNLKLRDTIRQGLVGDPLYFIVEYSQRKNIPLEVFRDWVCHTNILQYLGIHYIDIIYFATGAIPRRVLAVGQKDFLLRQGVDTFDAIQCVIEWEMGNNHRFTSVILTNWIDPERTSAMSDQKIKVIGTKGRYEADQKRRGITVITDDRGMEEPNPDFSAFYGTGKDEGISFQGYGPESILRFLEDVRSIKTKALKPVDLEGKRPTFRDALVPTAILEAANRSLGANGKWMDIKQKDLSFPRKRESRKE
jgi:predicted dehydrogenase